MNENTASVKEIAGVEDVFGCVDSLRGEAMPRAHLRLWFRGQAKFEHDLRPGVYRPDFFRGGSEAERLTKEQHMTKEFRVLSAGLRDARLSDWDLYFLQQHYRMPTRLLDWSTSPLTGLYFAVGAPGQDGQDTEDGALFMMDAERLAEDQRASSETLHFGDHLFKGITTARHPIVRKAIGTIFDWGKVEDGFPDFILPIVPEHLDSRISLQRGCFTFHVPRRSILTAKENRTLVKYKIPASAKATIRKQLSLLTINDFTIYGDLDHLADTLKVAFKH